ncbi:hypothetical protein DFH28DRAFT_901689, partial [Melampsora americana]
LGLASPTLDAMIKSSLVSCYPNQTPYDVGDCDDPSKSYRALHWKLERTLKTMKSASISYSECCQQGAVSLPSNHLENWLTPPFLQKLFLDQDNRASTHSTCYSRCN